MTVRLAASPAQMAQEGDVTTEQCPDEETILAFIGGRLSADGIEAIERHADICAACVELIASAAQGHGGGEIAEAGEPAAEAPPWIYGRYRILDRIGHGGMGDVHRAISLSSGQLVALKTVRADTGNSQQARRALKSIVREIQALSRVQHEGVAAIRDHGIEEGRPWYAMDFIEGDTLDARLNAIQRARKKSRREPDLATLTVEPLAIVCRLCETLAFVHGEGIVHGDLTPRNVVVRPSGTPVLVDFGLAARHDRLASDFLEARALVAGTPAYISPEQIRGEQIDPRTDLYALGCILYQIIVGQPPFVSSSVGAIIHRHLHEIPARPSEMMAGVDPQLDALVMRLLEKRPRDRLGNAEDVAHALAPWSGPVPRICATRRARTYVYQPELSGRGDLLASLDQLLDRGAGGHGTRVFIGGGSGIGKTRVLVDVMARARARHMEVVVGGCVAISATPRHDTERSSALHPLLPLLHKVVDMCAQTPALTERLLGQRGKVLAAYEPSILELPGQAAYPDPPALSPQAARHRLLTALQETIAALAAVAPLLIIIDDLQWADDLSLDLLETLPPNFCEERSILVLGAYRREEAAAHLDRVIRGPGVWTVPLGRVDAPTIGRMVGDMLALDEVPKELLDPIVVASEGNPFFVAEYLRLALERGWLRREVGSAYTFAGRDGAGAEPKVLPGSLQDLIVHRIEALGERARHIAEVGSVLGREFDADVLFAVASLSDEAGMDAARELMNRNMLEDVDGERLRFIHDKQREIAYEQMPEARRRDLHRRAGHAVEAKFKPNVPPALYAALAHHWVEI